MSKHYVQHSIDLLGSGLDPFIQEKMKPVLGSLEWTSVLKELDRMRGKDTWVYSRKDPSLQLRMLTERLGSLGYPFDEGDKNRTLSSYGSVLRIVRNRLAHGGEFEVFDALHAVDTVRTVLSHIGDEKRAEQAADLRTSLFNELLDADENPEQPESGPDPEKSPNLVQKPNLGHKQKESPESTDRVETLRGAVGWEPWRTVVVGEQTDLDSIRTNKVKENVRSLIEDIAEAEGPVHVERVAKLVARGFGFSKLPLPRRKILLAHISRASVIIDDDGFVWPEGIDRDKWLIYRTSNDVQRPFAQISPVEIANAAKSVLQHENSLDSSELRRRVFAQFGRTRGSSTATPQLELGLSYAKSSGRIR